MRMDVFVRRVSPHDYPFIAALNLELGYEFPEDRVEERIRHLSENTRDIVLVADLDGEVVGYIHASPYECLFSEPILNIVAFVVNENHRSVGIGRRLINAVEKIAQEGHFPCIRLTSAMHRSQAHRFYEARGYYGTEVKLYKKTLSE